MDKIRMNGKHGREWVLLGLIGITCLSLLNSMLGSGILQSGSPSFLKYEVYDAFVGELAHTVRINNPSYSIFAGGQLYVPLVKNETSRHCVILYNITSTVGQPKILKDTSDNLYACWKNIVINGKETFTAELNYRVLSFGTRYLIDPDRIADYDRTSELYKRYTQAEALIQSDNPEIVAKAKNVTNNIDNIHDTIRGIYDFATSHVRFSAQKEERGALWALENGSGDCSEYSHLFCALCRAIGVPARVQAGFAFQYSGQTMEDGHMWAEYYLENYGWVPVDATWRGFDQLDSKHFSSIQSIPEVIPYSNYFFNSTAEAELADKQTITLRQFSPEVFDDKSFAQFVAQTVQRTAQARLNLFLGKLFGASLVFSADVKNVEEELQQAATELQNTVESWQAKHGTDDVLHSSELLAGNASMLVIKALALFIGITLAGAILALICVRLFFRRSSRKLTNPTGHQA